METTELNAEQGVPKSEYELGYEVGLACDLRAFTSTVTAYMARGADFSEFSNGWEDGMLDSWLNGLRADLRGMTQPSRAYLQTGIANIVFAFKTKPPNG